MRNKFGRFTLLINILIIVVMFLGEAGDYWAGNHIDTLQYDNIMAYENLSAEFIRLEKGIVEGSSETYSTTMMMTGGSKFIVDARGILESYGTIKDTVPSNTKEIVTYKKLQRIIFAVQLVFLLAAFIINLISMKVSFKKRV